MACKKGQSGQILERTKKWLKAQGLELNEKKTRVVNIHDAGIDFLGFNMTWRRSLKGRPYLHVEPSQKSRRALREKLGEILNHWTRWKVQQLKNQSSIKVVRHLEEILAGMPQGASAQAVEKEVNYFQEHRARMDYRAGRRSGEPIGSGAVESSCRQAQCRFKRPGQYWSQQGDESLLCLETFWRNKRWHLLFPHNRHIDPSKN